MRDSANPTLTPLQRAVASHRITDGSLHRPGFRFANDAALVDAKTKAYADYERTLTTAYRTPSGYGGDPRRRDAAATGSNEEGVCPDCGGDGEINGQTCRRCGGTGEIGDHGDNEDDIVANETNTEGLGRNRTDNRSVNQIMRDHQTRMSKLYADIDRDLAEQWRRS